MRNTSLKAFAGSPAKHIRSDRPEHNKYYGADHTNEDHPEYWKKGLTREQKALKGWSGATGEDLSNVLKK